MSNNFRWFLRFIVYIPLSIALFLTMSYSYLTSQFEKNFEACLVQVPISQDKKTAREVSNFVGCLKSKGNFFISKIMREERLYEYAQPKMQCEFIGKWHVSEGYKEYWLTIQADNRFFIEPMYLGRDQGDKKSLVERTGVWSSSSKEKALQFYDDEYFWPINEYKIEWLSDKHFALSNILTEKNAFFHRSTPPDASCIESVLANSEAK